MRDTQVTGEKGGGQTFMGKKDSVVNFMSYTKGRL